MFEKFKSLRLELVVLLITTFLERQEVMKGKMPPWMLPIHQELLDTSQQLVESLKGRNIQGAFRIDRVEDSLIAGLRMVLEGLEKMYASTPLLENTPEQTELLEQTQRLKELLLPQGTGFLKKAMPVQWFYVRGMLEKTVDESTKKDLAGLSLKPGIERIAACHELYREALGLGQQGSPRWQSLLALWERKMERFVHAAQTAFYDFDESKESREALDILVGPYWELLARQEKMEEQQKPAPKEEPTPSDENEQNTTG
jgi:hypothetical protein